MDISNYFASKDNYSEKGNLIKKNLSKGSNDTFNNETYPFISTQNKEKSNENNQIIKKIIIQRI